MDGTYYYDGDGQRTRSVVRDSAGRTTTTDWTYEGLKLHRLSATRSDGTTWSIVYLYDAADRPYAGVYTGSDSATPITFTMLTTDRGDVAELLSTSGAPFASYRYDPWGNPIASGTLSQGVAGITADQAASIASRSVLRYAGYVYDAESSMYYCSARHYDPVTMQFISKDPAKADGEESAYQYGGGDPVGKVDPSGEWTIFGKGVPYGSHTDSHHWDLESPMIVSGSAKGAKGCERGALGIASSKTGDVYVYMTWKFDGRCLRTDGLILGEVPRWAGGISLSVGRYSRNASGRGYGPRIPQHFFVPATIGQGSRRPGKTVHHPTLVAARSFSDTFYSGWIRYYEFRVRSLGNPEDGIALPASKKPVRIANPWGDRRPH